MDVEFLEDDVVDGIGTGDGTGMGGCSLGTGLGLSGLEDDDGLFHRHALDGLDELLSVGDALAVHSDDLGVGVLGEISQEVALVEVAFVTEGDEVGKTYTVGTGPVEYGGSDGTGLGHDGDVPGLGKQVGEGVVHTTPDVHSSETVGSADPDTELLRLGDDLLLHLRSLRAVLLETGGKDAHMVDTCLRTVPDGLKDEGVLDGDDCEIDGFPDLLHVSVRLESLYLPAFRVDRTEFSFVSCIKHVLDEHPTELGHVVGSADDSYGFGAEEFQHGSAIYTSL